MPSVEPADENIPYAENGDPTGGNHNSTTEDPDPDRHLIPGDRIEHSEQIDMPTVREFTQNDTINKFLLNSFLQRINDNTNNGELREPTDTEATDEQEQDFGS